MPEVEEEIDLTDGDEEFTDVDDLPIALED